MRSIRPASTLGDSDQESQVFVRAAGPRKSPIVGGAVLAVLATMWLASLAGGVAAVSPLPKLSFLASAHELVGALDRVTRPVHGVRFIAAAHRKAVSKEKTQT